MLIESWRERFEELKKKKIDEITKQTNAYLKIFEKAKQFRKKAVKGELTRKQVESAMNVLCFKNPAYCCKSPVGGNPSRECMNRDSFWYAIGLDLKAFEEYKDECKKLFWKFLKTKGIRLG